MVRLSVVVCTYNRADYLIKALKHLKDQKGIARSDYEVIIVNNNSTDQTDAYCQRFLNENRHLDWTYVIETRQGHTFSRNRGIDESRGEIIAFIDDDAYVSDTYCAAIIVFLDEHPEVPALGGKIIPVYEGEPPKWMTRFLLPLVSALDMGQQVKKFSGSKFPIGANMVYRKKVFEKYGKFDTDLGRRGQGLEGGDEKELILRLKKNREDIYYVPQVMLEHIIPEKRLKMDYIKGLARGVAKSEKKRIKKGDSKELLIKIVSESIKIAGTVVLAVLYYLKWDTARANMLIRFRYWVITGYLTN